LSDSLITENILDSLKAVPLLVGINNIK